MSATETRVAGDALATDGRGPGGMWRVAFRLHRRTVSVTVIASLALIGIAVAFRLTFDAAARKYLGASYPTCLVGGQCPDGFAMQVIDHFYWWNLLRSVLVLVPAAAGVLIGVSAFAREIDQHTMVFAVTQSVGRLRWWAVTLTVAGLPLVALMIPIGFVLQWASQAHPWFVEPSFGIPSFAIFAFVPAALALAGVAIGALTGVLLRGSLAGLVVGLIVAAVVGSGVEAVRPHLLTPVTTVYPADNQAYPSTLAGADSWYVDSGWLDAQGREVEFGACGYDGAATEAEAEAAWTRCLADAGIVNRFENALPADRLTDLRLAVSALLAGLAALFLAAGAAVVRRRAVR